MVVRQEICSAKLRNQLPSFDIVLSAVKRYYEMEKYIYQTNLRENESKKKWFHFRKYFESVGNVQKIIMYFMFGIFL